MRHIPLLLNMKTIIQYHFLRVTILLSQYYSFPEVIDMIMIIEQFMQLLVIELFIW